MNFIISWFVKKFGVSALIIAIDIVYFSIVIAFYFFVVSAILDIYHLVQTLFDMISSASTGGGSGSSVTSLFSSLLTVSGFVPALKNSFPLISSALVFVLTKYLYKVFKQAYSDIITQLKKSASLMV